MSAYEPDQIEKKWGVFWEENDLFKADNQSSKQSYTISIPPPNVTGVLHMGHALVDTLQDILIRMKRMQGFEALWVPGTDHAGIATQTVVERDQMAKTGKRRKDFSREDFLSLVWAWKEKSETTILSQLKRLGCSCDWSRLRFTMDEQCSKAVKTMFKKMFDEGLIYRGDYLVNWDPATQTALADDEVEYEDKASNLWYIRYPIENSSEFLCIATTRPETMLADTAVAVNPKDERFAHLIGKQILLPLSDRKIPIIADPYVDPEFGTGAVKITPGHDPNDYEMGLRHDLPLLNMMTPDGRVNEIHPTFTGLTMEEARLKVADAIKELGLMEKIEPHNHRVGVSYRSKAVIEPYLSKQWFVKMSAFKEKLISAVKDGKVKIIPKDWENTYFHWIENLRDWCISRQLWWGHRIPVWMHKDNPEQMVCSGTDELPKEVQEHPEDWVQDEDVLDTWFSSGLWPFSVLGWPEKTPDLEKFYPNSVLVTGHDILFFWVARMLLMGEYALGEFPFPETFVHGLIYGKSYWRNNDDGTIAYVKAEERIRYDLGEALPTDVNAKWEKMSKSKGNVIDPIEIIETYGTDAMRFALCSVATHARQIDLDRRRFEEYKNFINKIWNGARFVFSHLETLNVNEGIDHEALTLEDRWILSKLNRIIATTTKHFETYAFDKGANDLYHFFWDEFCAYYLELVKPYLFGKTGTEAQKANKQKILAVVLSNVIRLMHPIAPFVTEELFETLKGLIQTTASIDEPYLGETLNALGAKGCIVAPYPTVILEKDMDEKIEKGFAFMDQILHAIRTIRAEMQLTPNIATTLYIESEEEQELEEIKENQEILFALVRLESIHFQSDPPQKGLCATHRVGHLKLTIPLPQEMQEKERVRLIKTQEKLQQRQAQLNQQLSNKQFVERAPKHLVEKAESELQQAKQRLAELEKQLKALEA